MSNRGLTYIEILVVVVMVSILTLAAIPLAKNTIKREKEIELRRNLRIIRTAIDEYKKAADKKEFDYDEDTYGYPPDLETLVKGVKTKKGKILKFLRRIPKDPMTKDGEWGLRSYQDERDSEVWGGENVYDVYSQSREKGLDGTKYNEW